MRDGGRVGSAKGAKRNGDAEVGVPRCGVIAGDGRGSHLSGCDSQYYVRSDVGNDRGTGLDDFADRVGDARAGHRSRGGGGFLVYERSCVDTDCPDASGRTCVRDSDAGDGSDNGSARSGICKRCAEGISDDCKVADLDGDGDGVYGVGRNDSEEGKGGGARESKGGASDRTHRDVPLIRVQVPGDCRREETLA